MIPQARLIHDIPGRMRMRIPSRRGDEEYFAVLRDRLTRLHGIERVETNSLTGSLLLFHHVEKDTVAAYALENTLFYLQPSSFQADPLSEKMVRSFQQIDRNLSASTGGELDLASLAFLVLLGMGTVEIIRGNFTAPAWYTAFWYAFSVIMGAHARRPPEDA